MEIKMPERKGLILAGGSGTRLYPLTSVTSKQLLPIYDKPMIYYPLSTLMSAKIRNILLISTNEDIPRFSALLGDGSQFGINIEYMIQPSPDGLAQSFLLGKRFINGSNSALILGDNIFYSSVIESLFKESNQKTSGATIFAYKVSDPRRYGVVEFEGSKVISIEEKPSDPKSDYAVTGLYFYDSLVCDYASELKPSKRGELEITDLNNIYLKNNQLSVEFMDKGYSWFDTGTFDSLNDASQFVSLIQKRQGSLVGCPEEIAYRNSWIDLNDLEKAAHRFRKNNYGQYLSFLANKEI